MPSCVFYGQTVETLRNRKRTRPRLVPLLILPGEQTEYVTHLKPRLSLLLKLPTPEREGAPAHWI